nr:quinoprotein relay system zinc metallohydrolase 2 [Enterovibrio norvegicus]
MNASPVTALPMNTLARITALFVLLSFPFGVFANAPKTLAFEEIAPGVHVHQGKIDDLFTTQFGPVANATFIVGETSVALIDSGGSRRAGEMIYTAIRAVTPLPIRYVINTHVHPDHNFGNQAFLSEKPEFVAHFRYPGDFTAKAGYYLQRLNTPWFEGTTPVAATWLIDTSTQFDLGNRRITLTPHDRAHTRHDLSVFDEQTQTLIAGDLLFVEHIPTLDGNLIGWLKVMDELDQLPYQRVVPGHGAVQLRTTFSERSAFAHQRHYLESLTASVRDAIHQHIDINTASNTLMKDHAKQWALFDAFHPRNVIQAYKELEWE